LVLVPLIASFKEGRMALGVEIDERYINLSIERLKKEIDEKQKSFLIAG
jgi:DNA modification methylase